MSTDDEQALREILTSHAHPGEILYGLGDAWMTCACGVKFDLPIVDDRIHDGNGPWLAHVTDPLAGYVTTKQAEALREAAMDVPFLDPEVADEVIDWLRDRADRIAP